MCWNKSVIWLKLSQTVSASSLTSSAVRPSSVRKNDHLDFVSPECQIVVMEAQGIHVTKLPELKAPLLIAGFDGWGNALGIW